jgi:drug/metabolite transporter (DMT)-like permease
MPLTKAKADFWYGILCCVLAEASYGVNGFGASHLYAAGFKTPSVLFYRFTFAAVFLLAILIARREPFRTSRRDLAVGCGCGVLFAASALTLYLSFTVMDTGLACTILFVYPLMVVAMMALFFHERITWPIITAIGVAMAGVALLSLGGGTVRVSAKGFALIMTSAATYAVYMVAYRTWPPTMSPYKMAFLSIASSDVCILLYGLATGSPPQRLTAPSHWGWQIFLAIVPTVVSIFFTVEAIKYVGPTLTAILGALEPLTALVLGVAFLGEALTFRLGIGAILVLGAVIFVVLRPTRDG